MKFIIPIIILIILYFIIQILYKKGLVNKYLKQLTAYFKERNLEIAINNVKNLKKVYEIKTENKNYFIQLVIVPLNSRIQINNNITWELKTGGKEGIGDAPSKVTRLTEIEKFMLTSFDGKKIVVFLPNVKKIVKYINECEIVLVNELTDVYGAKVVSADNFKVYN